jgi:threonine/homoserine/homoserine lactone efflux protein
MRKIMDLDAIAALAALAVSMTWTPGPNNTMLTASGANFGWRRTLPHAMGVAIGFPVMLVAVALGLGGVFEAEPRIATLLTWIGFAAMLYFAWRIATADAAHSETRPRPLTFVEASAFQWINPKAWTFAIWVAATYAVGTAALTNIALAAVVFLLSGLGSSQTWTLFGTVIGRLIGTGWKLRAFNIAMALLLAASAVWLTFGAGTEPTV